MQSGKKLKIVVIDGSAVEREVIGRAFVHDRQIELTGIAADVKSGNAMALSGETDVLALDIELPGMAGIEYLRRLMAENPLPVVILSSLTQKGKYITMQAMESGAVDFVQKPATENERNLSSMISELRKKVIIASEADVSRWSGIRKTQVPEIDAERYGRALYASGCPVVAIGASTGGIDAVRKVIEKLPAETPGIVVALSVPHGFTKTFADRLDEISAMRVKEAENGERVARGKVMIAPGDFHAMVQSSGGKLLIELEQSEKVNGHRPSADVLFFSISEHAGEKAVGIILTGEGKDGAVGLKSMKHRGARTIGQNEATSLVYGMPKEAFESGAVDSQLPLNMIPSELIKTISGERF